MHNLKANFDKFLRTSKSILGHLLYPDGNFKQYKNPPKFTDIEVLARSVTAEALGIDSEIYYSVNLRQIMPKTFQGLHSVATTIEGEKACMDILPCWPIKLR